MRIPLLFLLTLLLALRAHAAPVAPAASAADMPPLADLLERAGWSPTPELSGVYRPGSIFLADEGRHSLMLRDCFDQEPGVDTYTSMELVSSLQAGVRVRSGLFSGKGEAELVRRIRFGTPEHHTLEGLALQPTADCARRLQAAPRHALESMYVVQEVLTAEIAEQTCGRIDAEGRFVGLGKAEAELQRACQQVALEPVAVAYRVVPVPSLALQPGAVPPIVVPPGEPVCPWGTPRAVSSTMTTLTVNGVTMDVRGAEQRMMIQQAMQACERPEAARAFEIWRQYRRTVNITAATVVGFYPFGIGLGAAFLADDWRLRMEQLLLDPAVASERNGRGWRKRVR